jgi:hypothetical protein
MSRMNPPFGTPTVKVLSPLGPVPIHIVPSITMTTRSIG